MITTDGPAVAGYNFTITCAATLITGLGMPSVVWKDPSDQVMNSSGNVLINQVTSGQTTHRILYFDPLRTSDQGRYICTATLFSSSLNISLNSSASYYLDVQLSKIPSVIGHTFLLSCSIFSFPNSCLNSPHTKPKSCPYSWLSCSVGLLSRWWIWPCDYTLDINLHKNLFCAQTIFSRIYHFNSPALC